MAECTWRWALSTSRSSTKGYVMICFHFCMVVLNTFFKLNLAYCANQIMCKSWGTNHVQLMEYKSRATCGGTNHVQLVEYKSHATYGVQIMCNLWSTNHMQLMEYKSRATCGGANHVQLVGVQITCNLWGYKSRATCGGANHVQLVGVQVTCNLWGCKSHAFHEVQNPKQHMGYKSCATHGEQITCNT